MTKHPEMDPLDELRGANPIDADRLSSASLARIRARVSEDVMHTTNGPPRMRWSTRVIGLAGGAIVAGAVALAVYFGGAGTAPGSTPGSSLGAGSASCVEQYSPANLARRSFAFDGTVTAIEGERVTFTVGTSYLGPTGSITLDAPGMTGTAITSAGGPNLIVGKRYLVAGDDRFAWACGYTQPYDSVVAAEWAAALGG
jgi:hypothetical protein